MEKSWSDYISAELLRFSKDQEDSELWVRFQQVHLKGTDILGRSYSFFLSCQEFGERICSTQLDNLA